MRRRVRFALACVAVTAAGTTTGFALRPAPEPEPRCVLDRLERVPGRPQLNIPGSPIVGGGLYQFVICDDVHEIRQWVGP